VILPFDPLAGIIAVPTRVSGPGGDVILRFALDTGATSSAISWQSAALLGYDPAAVPSRVEIITGSGVEYAPRITVMNIQAMGQERRDFAILCHTLPPSATVDGVLGLDFFKGCRLTLDFRTGIVTVD
jgi:predicted aspartyl protease